MSPHAKDFSFNTQRGDHAETVQTLSVLFFWNPYLHFFGTVTSFGWFWGFSAKASEVQSVCRCCLWFHLAPLQLWFWPSLLPATCFFANRFQYVQGFSWFCWGDTSSTVSPTVPLYPGNCRFFLRRSFVCSLVNVSFPPLFRLRIAALYHTVGTHT